MFYNYQTISGYIQSNCQHLYETDNILIYFDNTVNNLLCLKQDYANIGMTFSHIVTITGIETIRALELLKKIKVDQSLIENYEHIVEHIKNYFIGTDVFVTKKYRIIIVNDDIFFCDNVKTLDAEFRLLKTLNTTELQNVVYEINEQLKLISNYHGDININDIIKSANIITKYTTNYVNQKFLENNIHNFVNKVQSTAFDDKDSIEENYFVIDNKNRRFDIKLLYKEQDQFEEWFVFSDKWQPLSYYKDKTDSNKKLLHRLTKAIITKPVICLNDQSVYMKDEYKIKLLTAAL